MIILFTLGAVQCRTVVTSDRAFTEKASLDALGAEVWIPFGISPEQLGSLYRQALSETFVRDSRDSSPVVARGAKRRPDGVVEIDLGQVSERKVSR